MYTQTKSQIIEIIAKNGPTTVKDLVQELGITQAAVHRALNKLMAQEQISKKGSAPKVFYELSKKKPFLSSVILADPELLALENHYLYVDPTGKFLTGLTGFTHWMRATSNKQKPENCVRDYLQTLDECAKYRKPSGLIEATKRFQDIFSECHLEKIYYSDFYSLVKFGKTKLGALLLHGKQAQDKKIIKQISDLIQTQLKTLIKTEKIDAVAWTPHSLPRKVQFLYEVEKNLQLPYPRIEIVKAYTGAVPIAQKSLAKLEERILNARETLVVKPKNISYKNILLIDDAVGSGSTLNELAHKLKQKGAKRVVGYSIVGSYKGFEVIREV